MKYMSIILLSCLCITSLHAMEQSEASSTCYVRHHEMLRQRLHNVSIIRTRADFEKIKQTISLYSKEGMGEFYAVSLPNKDFYCVGQWSCGMITGTLDGTPLSEPERYFFALKDLYKQSRR